jgi:hypothetical protein
LDDFFSLILLKAWMVFFNGRMKALIDFSPQIYLNSETAPSIHQEKEGTRFDQRLEQRLNIQWRMKRINQI